MSRVHLVDTQKQRIVEQLEAAYPDEAAGFLLGYLTEGHIAAYDIVIQEAIPVENVSQAEERHHRFSVTPQDWARYEDLADERGLMLIGCYHSHPDSPARPSEYDKAHALPNFLYLIVSVRAGKAGDFRAWELSPDSKLEHTVGEATESELQEFLQKIDDSEL